MNFITEIGFIGELLKIFSFLGKTKNQVLIIRLFTSLVLSIFWYLMG